MPKLNIDLLFELERELTPTGQRPTKSFIKGLRLCVGVSEGKFAAHAAEQLKLTERDRGVFRYYERWPEGYNLVSDLLPWNEVASLPPLELSTQGTKHIVRAKPRLDPVDVLEFFYPFNVMAPGDLVSLGALANGVEITKIPCRVELRFGTGWSFHVAVESAVDTGVT